jgi:acylphosphatase
MIRHIQINVTGKVENTGFRLYSMRGASEYQIKGNVRQDNNMIIIEAEGEESYLNLFIEWCHKGPQSSQVHTITSTEKELAGYTDFKIL